MSRPGAPRIGLVDPVRTAHSFFAEFERRSLDYVTVESGLLPFPLPKVDGQVVRATPTIELMAQELRKLRITHLIGCVDPSIAYADRLCAQLGLPFNGLRLSEARRNKTLMNEALGKAGLRTPFQHETDTLDDLLAWLRSVSYPAVIKPVSSGGTDNVFLCSSDREAAECFRKIYETKNLMGAINTSVLAQEYVDGTEYVVDCVSFGGAHTPVDFFEYQKGIHNGRAFIYEKERFLKSEDPISQRLLSFAREALDALEFRNGASHMEVKINSKSEIVFIEVGPRLNGGDIYKLVRDTRADGKSQVEFTVDAVLGLPSPVSDYETRKEGVRVYIISKGEGCLKSMANLERIRALPSFTRISLHVEVGQLVARTTDLTNDAGWIDLTNADLATLRADERQLDEILREGVLIFE